MSKLSQDSGPVPEPAPVSGRTMAFGTPEAPAPTFCGPGGTLFFDPQAVNGAAQPPGGEPPMERVRTAPIVVLNDQQVSVSASGAASTTRGAGGAQPALRELVGTPAHAALAEPCFQLASVPVARRASAFPGRDMSGVGQPPSTARVDGPSVDDGRPTPAPANTEPEPRRASPFRNNALQARFEETSLSALPVVTTSRWATLLLLSSLALVLLTIAYLGQVEVTSKAVGSLRVAGGPRPITAQASGVITSLSVKAGDQVEADQLLARVEARDLYARVERNSRQVGLLREEGQRAKEAGDSLQQKTIAALEHKRGLLWKRARLKKAQIAARRSHAARMRELVRQGAASEFEALTAEEAASTAEEELLSLQQQAAEIGVEIADRRYAYGAEDIDRAFRIREAEVGLAEAETLAVLGGVKAPESGRVESLMVTEGQVVQAGEILGRVIPEGQASSVVVFAPAKDAAFLEEGQTASVEFISLPVSEYGKATGRVTRVASDLAVPREVNDVLGNGPEASADLVRVEVTVVADETWEKMAPRLSSGARVIARLQTRKRRIITLLFDFLRSWYPE